MLARPIPGLAKFLHAHSQASLQMALQKLRSIRCANDQHLAPAEDGLVMADGTIREIKID
jgi:hypothetical protein